MIPFFHTVKRKGIVTDEELKKGSGVYVVAEPEYGLNPDALHEDDFINGEGISQKFSRFAGVSNLDNPIQADKNFLLSLEEDMHCLNRKAKLTFKRKVLQMMEHLLYKKDTETEVDETTNSFHEQDQHNIVVSRASEIPISTSNVATRNFDMPMI